MIGGGLTSRAEAEKALRWTAPVNAFRVANMMNGFMGIREEETTD